MSELDREAISATIMDALVYDGAIDPEWEFLDLTNCLKLLRLIKADIVVFEMISGKRDNEEM